MTLYAIGRPGELVRQYIETSVVSHVHLNIGDGEVVVMAETRPGGARVYIDADGTALEAVAPDLAERREACWTGARAYRELCAEAGCSTALGRVDTDEKSQRKISGAVQMAMIAMGASQPFSIDWTMSDNSVAAHDAAAMIALGVAVGQHVAGCQLAGTAIRDAIAASDEPESVDITAGYPA